MAFEIRFMIPSFEVWVNKINLLDDLDVFLFDPFDFLVAHSIVH
tara:strand:+ start:85 stop:216 length:132 start_codon:yes stop_codon:yes gene_type:complete